MSWIGVFGCGVMGALLTRSLEWRLSVENLRGLWYCLDFGVNLILITTSLALVHADNFGRISEVIIVWVLGAIMITALMRVVRHRKKGGK